MNREVRFGFGRNWTNFVRRALNEEKIQNAQNSLLSYLPAFEYSGKTFVDVGCGSGIFSLAAARLGCRKIISFDLDPLSVSATRSVQQKFSGGAAQNSDWEIFVGDILDESLVRKYENQGDLVYSWGVLHHTGRMWAAVRNAARLVKPDGRLILAIYNEAPFSPFWLRVKKTFNHSGRLVRGILIGLTCWVDAWQNLTVKAAFWRKRNSQTSRGMSRFYDLVDWLGGYPYEFAPFDAVRKYVEDIGFQLERAPTQLPSPPLLIFRKQKSLLFKILRPYSYLTYYTGNNEFVFKKTAQPG